MSRDSESHPLPGVPDEQDPEAYWRELVRASIVNMRDRMGLTQFQFAERLSLQFGKHVRQSKISGWESPNYKELPRVETYLAMMAMAGIQVDAVLGLPPQPDERSVAELQRQINELRRVGLGQQRAVPLFTGNPRDAMEMTEVCRELGRSRISVYKYIGTHRLPVYRDPGGPRQKLKFLRSDVEKLKAAL